MTGKAKSISIHPQSFVEESLCDLCFEDALKVGAMKSAKVPQSEWKETSVRLCIDGLAKWYKSFAKQYREGSVFSMMRDISWQWASFCENNETLSRATKEYFDLLKEITEDTPYTDLAERMDEARKYKELGWRGRPINVSVPHEAHGIISDTGLAVGLYFSQFFQVGLAWSLSKNRRDLYKSWSETVFQPLFDEVMGMAEKRLRDFSEIRVTLWYRKAQGGDPSETK